MNLLITALVILLIAYFLRRLFGRALDTALTIMLVLLLIGVVADPIGTRSIILHIVDNVTLFIDRLRFVFGF